MFGQYDIARSACAVIVSDGLTPRFAETAAPSTTEMPGCPYSRWYGSTTPSSGEAPIGQPPRKCAVSGVPISSPTLLPGKPLISSASRLAARVASSICTGLGAPCPWRAVSRPLPRPPGLRYVVSELSSDCMTRPMMVRSDQRRLDSERTSCPGCFAVRANQARTRCLLYGTWRTVRKPMALEPRP